MYNDKFNYIDYATMRLKYFQKFVENWWSINLILSYILINHYIIYCVMRLTQLSNQFISTQSSLQSFASLKKKTIVITGASRGIGLAIAKKCAQEGCNVAILAKTTT